MKTIKIRQTRHAGHCWRSKNELISNVLLWTPTHGRAKAGRPARTYIQQLCAGTGCSSEDLSEAMDDREGGWERVRDICADGATWWWWWLLLLSSYIQTVFSHFVLYIYICIYIYIYIYTTSQKYLVTPKIFIFHPKSVIFNESS